MSPPTPAQALWNQRAVLAARRPRLQTLLQAVGRPTDLCPFQWSQLLAYALEFKPDLIIELGRGHGNSTCCFLEACDILQPAHPCRLHSFCLGDDWFRFARPRLAALSDEAWFEAGRFHWSNICTQDFTTTVADSQRTLVFWDAHGFDVAAAVLGHLLPLLESRSHVVIMHDLTDTRYCFQPNDYETYGLWSGANAADSGFWLGHIFSRVAQAISIVDFTTRNQLPFHSADESMHTEIGADTQRADELHRLLGDDFFSLQAHWFWFSLNEATRPLTFPRPPSKPPIAPGLLHTIKKTLQAGMNRLTGFVPSGDVRH